MTSRPSTMFTLAVFDVAGTTVLDGDAVVECLTQVLAMRTSVSRRQVLEVRGLPKPVAIRELLASPGGMVGAALDAAVNEAHAEFCRAMIERYRDGFIAPADGVEPVFAAYEKLVFASPSTRVSVATFSTPCYCGSPGMASGRWISRSQATRWRADARTRISSIGPWRSRTSPIPNMSRKSATPPLTSNRGWPPAAASSSV